MSSCMVRVLDHGLSTAIHGFIYSRIVLLSLWSFILEVHVIEKNFMKVRREMPWAQKDVCAVVAAAAKVWER